MDEKVIAAFILGLAAGITLHRLIMVLVLNRWPDERCAYCEWLGRKRAAIKMATPAVRAWAWAAVWVFL